MTPDDVDKIIDDKLTSFTNMTVPTHTHNAVDAPQILIQNVIIAPNSGIPFISGTNQYNVYVVADFGTSPLVIEPSSSFINSIVGSPTEGENTSQLYLGAGGSLNGNALGQVFVFTNSLAADAEIYMESTAFDTGDSSAIDVRPAAVAITTNQLNLLASSSGDFAIQLPAGTLPTAAEGMIAYDGTDFRGVDSSGTWKTFTLT